MAPECRAAPGAHLRVPLCPPPGLHGAKVVISGRREQVLRDACTALAAEGVAAHYVQGDVRNFELCERVVAEALAKYGRLDILVNCAGGC